MNEDDLPDMHEPEPPQPPVDHVGTLGYRSKVEADDTFWGRRISRSPGTHWSTFAFALGIAFGFLPPPFLLWFGISTKFYKNGIENFFALWASWVFLTGIGGFLFARRIRVKGFLSGLLTGTLIQTGFCALVPAMCGSSHW